MTTKKSRRDNKGGLEMVPDKSLTSGCSKGPFTLQAKNGTDPLKSSTAIYTT